MTTKVHKAFLWLGAYGASSPKPTYLWSNNDCFLELGKRALPTDVEWRDKEKIARHYIDCNGMLRVQGGPKLKQTQPQP